ncbi:MAG: NAD(P)-dependent oxidoreductase [Quisquiliibacterium sp.]
MADTVGVIGVGAMGMGILRSAMRGGFDGIARDLDPAREQIARASGARIAASAAELGAQADVIFVVVIDSQQIEQVLSGPHGLLAAVGPGKVVLFDSTISPTDAANFAARLEQTGAMAIDAPISGGPARAEAGTMSMMLAGDGKALDRAAQVLKSVSDKRFVVGQRHGDAMRAKLVNNLMAGINLMAGAEAIALAERLGLDPKALFDLVSVSSGQSWMFEDRMARALAGDYAPTAAAPVLTKDLRLVNEAAAELGIKLPLGALAHQQLQATCDSGWHQEDDAAVLKLYRQLFAN